MKLKLLTAVAGAVLLIGSGLASAHGDIKRDHRGPSYHGQDRSWHGQDRGWHKNHRPQVRKHHHVHPRANYRGWHGAHRDGVTIIFRGRLH